MSDFGANFLDNTVSEQFVSNADGFSGLINPDEFFLENVELITSTQRLNIKGLMVELSYYEDIFRGTITGHVLINDAISLIDRQALCGTETLIIKYRKSKQAMYYFEKKFRVYRVGDRAMRNNTSEVYTLNFCSEELFLSEQLKISKAYPGKQISEIVKDILVQEMRVVENEKKNEKKLLIEQTKGLYDFIIPYKKPYEAINWLSTYAQSQRNPGADFVFYENVYGLNFRSLQSLYTTKPYRTFVYSLRTVGDRGSDKELGISLSGIKSYTFLDTFDTLYATNLGVFANKTISIDPLTRSYYTTTFNYSDYMRGAKSLNGEKIISANKNVLGKAAYENENAVLKVLTTNRNQKKAIGVDPSDVANDVGVETYVPNRTAQLALAHYSRMKIAVSGDPLLAVGLTINIVLPSMRSPDSSGNFSGDIDRYHSGQYIITAVRHIIDVNMKYETILEIAKDSLETALPYSDKSVNFPDRNMDPSAPVSGGVIRSS
jgi:hypothetical protein